jgi:hypothetical protein
MYGRTNVTQKQYSWPHKTLCKTSAASAQICTQHQRMIAKGLYCPEIQHHKCWLSTFLQLPAKFRTFQTYRDAMRHTQIWYILIWSHRISQDLIPSTLSVLGRKSGSCPPKGWSRTEQDGDVTLWQDDINDINSMGTERDQKQWTWQSSLPQLCPATPFASRGIQRLHL